MGPAPLWISFCSQIYFDNGNQRLCHRCITSMTQYNVGIIGYGWAASAHIPAINAAPQAQVAAIYSSRKLDAKELSAKHGGTIKVYNDLDSLLADPDIDVVSICSYPLDHAQRLGWQQPFVCRLPRAGHSLALHGWRGGEREQLCDGFGQQRFQKIRISDYQRDHSEI